MNQPIPWWNKDSSNGVISGKKLLDFWQSMVFSKRESAASEIQSLGDLTKVLWATFNTSREELDRDYMSNEKLLTAYMASFFIPNVERILSIATNPRVKAQLKKISQSKSIHILDFGSGPLSATFGLLLALNEIKESKDNVTFATEKIVIHAVERSERAVKKAIHLLNNSISSNIFIEVHRTTSIPRDQQFNIVLAANVFNEIPEKHRSVTARSIISALTPDSSNIAIFMEPGQREHSKKLTDLRNDLLSQSTQFKTEVIAPCPHNDACPLSSKFERDDWCWFSHHFERPDVLKEIDKKSSLDHTNLAYSFFALNIQHALSDQVTQKTPWSVCVSDEMSAGEPSSARRRFDYFKNNLATISPSVSSTRLEQLAETGSKTKLCCRTADFLSGLRMQNQTDGRLKRGDELDDKSIFEALILEK